jgi:hypothetical protein
MVMVERCAGMLLPEQAARVRKVKRVPFATGQDGKDDASNWHNHARLRPAVAVDEFNLR